MSEHGTSDSSGVTSVTSKGAHIPVLQLEQTGETKFNKGTTNGTNFLMSYRSPRECERLRMTVIG